MLRQAGARIAPLLCAGRAAASCYCWSVSQQLSTVPHLEPQAAELQQQLLAAAVKHVKQYGWSRGALIAAARDLDLSPACAGMFPRGPSELVEHVIHQHNQQLAQELQESQQHFLSMPLPARIAAAVRRRLEMNAPYMDSLPQALALLAQPRNSAAALHLLAQLLDGIWYAAGDTSTDSSWYTKRAMLAGIYTSTELYMLTDFSAGYEDTWKQLDRRVQDALWLGGAVSSLAAGPQKLLDLLLTGVSAAAPASNGGASSSSSSSSSSSRSASSGDGGGISGGSSGGMGNQQQAAASPGPAAAAGSSGPPAPGGAVSPSNVASSNSSAVIDTSSSSSSDSSSSSSSSMNVV